MRIAIVTPGGLAQSELEDHVASALTQAARHHVVVLLRDPSLARDEDHRRERAVRACCAIHGAQLLVHQNLEPSPEANLHLPDGPSQLAQLERLRTESGERCLSASTHSPSAADRAAQFADVVFLGPIWATIGKPHGLGPRVFQSLTHESERRGRIYAIGGIDSRHRAEAAIAAGADGIAGIRAFDADGLARLLET